MDFYLFFHFEPIVPLDLHPISLSWIQLELKFAKVIRWDVLYLVIFVWVEFHLKLGCLIAESRLAEVEGIDLALIFEVGEPLLLDFCLV